MSFEDKLRAASERLLFEPRFMDPTAPTGLWFCTDVYDADARKINAVCLHSGGEWDDLNLCADFLQQFCYLFIVCGDPKRRKDMVEQIQERVTYMPILVADDKGFRGCKSLAALSASYGVKSVDEVLFYQHELPAYGLLNLADVEMPDVSTMPKVYSGIKELDIKTGGFLMGQLSVWTGKRGEGKSTILGQLLLDAVDQGEVVCAYSGELPDWQFRYWTYLQAAGPKHITYGTDKVTGKRTETVPAAVDALISPWLDKRFLLYDLKRAVAHDGDSILKTFEYAHRRYGASVFLVDNIMTAKFKGSRDVDFYRAQSAFVGQLIEFAKRYQVHVHLVAHPKKSDGGKQYLTADDVGGSGDITNRADNVFSMEREVETENGITTKDRTILSIIKNRMFGLKENIELRFNQQSKRFYRPKADPADKRYGWELTGEQLRIEDADPAEDPFPAKGA